MVKKNERESDAVKQERYIGFYLDTELFNKVVNLAEIKTSQTGVKHSQSDILRIAVNDLLKKNGLLATSDQEQC